MRNDATNGALKDIRICDFTGQLAGAGATRFLAAFGAQVIRIDNPTDQGRWDILRGSPPYIDERRGINLGGAYNQHNVEKLGITLNLKSEKGPDLLRRLIAISDVVTENFGAGALARLGFDYEALCAIKPDIIYVSNCGFGHVSPYRDFKTWGPSVQAISGLTFNSGLPDLPSAGWGWSYMDHTAAYYQAMAVLLALYHRARTGVGQWVDLSSVEAGATLNGPVTLDYTANGRPLRREGMPHSNRSQHPLRVPHGIFEAQGVDAWVAIDCRDDRDWRALATAIGEVWATASQYASLEGRAADEDELERRLSRWTRQRDPFESERLLQAAGVPAAAVRRPRERIDEDPDTAAWGLWPEVLHSEIGRVRVEGIPAHLSETDWRIERGAPCLGEHNERVYGEILGLRPAEIESLRAEGVI